MTTTDFTQQSAVLGAITEFLKLANEDTRKPAQVTFSAERSGSKFRIVETAYGSKSVHAFVDADTGDLLKAAGWKVPAKGVRYNLLTEMEAVKANFDWTGGYLYSGARK